MYIDTRVPYRLGTAKLAPLPNEWDLVNDCFPPKVQEAMAIARKHLKDEPIAMLYIRRRGEERNTALILSSYAPALENKWRKAIKELYECFEHEEGLIAEIVDYHVHNPPLPKSITTAEVDLHQVAALFDDHEWMTVDVLRWYSPVRQETWPTIVITARDIGKDSWWSTKIPAVKQYVKDYGLDLDVVLLFMDKLLPGACGHAEGQNGLWESVCRGLYYYTAIGDSVGIQNMDGSESLGCRVLVEDGRQFGVIACRNFRRGLESTQTGLIGLNVQSPSSYDDCVVKKNQADNQKSEKLEISNLGKISAVSSSGSWLTDWGIYEMHRLDTIRRAPEVWARVKNGKTYQVKKFGRSTGLQKGTINAPSSIINSKHIEYAHMQGACTMASARCIVSKDMPFCLPGDYGACVQENDSGAILGLCVAYNEATKVSYMTPMATIVGEINDAVASKIKEPKETQLE
ncbi:hypothetical protein EJ04DRAFT_596343 [Polyplosphaeria fusca]|uniref:Uncharacterized protein n=1 Tax=Polyplosphaeria fusca TaxID=682080 RepID=A0A9P4UUB3_9PLEO|nr:hypothetical protein EJ04DRAFT_596343 [Polyplosphaeria fusca]